MSANSEDNRETIERPAPREPNSPAQVARILAQNRRREYLTRHPSYFDSMEHELADPVLYERLVKRYQSAAEREAEGKAKGYGRTLEADLQRGEAKLSTLSRSQSTNGAGGEIDDLHDELLLQSDVTDKESGLMVWHEFLEARFVRGQDPEFDYGIVDVNEDLDSLIRKDAEDAWYEDEEPSWVADEGTPAPRRGETGVQDF